MMLSKHWKLLVCILLLLTTLASAYFFLRSYLRSYEKLHRQSSKIIISHSPYLSEKITEQFNDLIIKSFHEGNSVDIIFAQIKEYLPAITQVTINRFKPGFTKIAVKIDPPLLLLKLIDGRNLIASHNGSCSSQEFYNQDLIKDLPELTINHEYSFHEAKELLQWLKNLPDNFLFNHRIVWYKNTKIIVHTNNNPNLEIVASTHTKFTPNLIRNIEIALLKQHEKKTNYSKKQKSNNITWIADVRFHNQIILTSKTMKKNKKGKYHEK